MKETTPLTSRTEDLLPPPGQKAAFVQANFDAIAPHYDRFNDWITFGMHRLWKRRTVAETGLRGKKARVLDACSGSGDLTLAFLDSLAPGSSIVSLDFSRQMLELLKSRIAARPDTGIHVETVAGDAMELPYQNEFDAVSMGFGLRNVEDRAKTLAGVFRALRSKGKFVLLDTGKPPAFLGPFFRLYFESIVPRIGHWLHGQKHVMYNYLPASARNYPDAAAMKLELEAAGFRNVKIKTFSLGACSLHTAEKP